jgi:hypothetical protein
MSAGAVAAVHNTRVAIVIAITLAIFLVLFMRVPPFVPLL